MTSFTFSPQFSDKDETKVIFQDSREARPRNRSPDKGEQKENPTKDDEEIKQKRMKKEENRGEARSGQGSTVETRSVLFERMLFIYAKEGQVKAYSAEEIRPIEIDLKRDGWHHTATIDPARWIEELANGNENPSDILDKIQFKPNAESCDPTQKGS